MQSDYHIEDLVYQTGDLVVYRARNKNGIPHAVNRIKFPYEIISGLEGGKFQEAYEELLTFDHPCVRTVVDGGQDPVDSFPWVATKWWNGTVLGNKAKDAPLSGEELQRVQTNAESLIEAYGERAAAFSFKPQSVIVTRGPDGGLVDTFAIDYFAWFRDWSLGLPPGGNRDPKRELEKMIDSLQNRPSPAKPQAIPKPEPASVAPPKLAIPTQSAPSNAGPISPSVQVALPSSSSGGSAKAIGVIVLLVSLVAGGLWWIKNQPPKADPQVETPLEETEKEVIREDTGKAPPKIVTETPDTTPPKIVSDPVPTPPTPADPERPSEGEILEVEDNDLIALKKSVGTWVFVNTEVARMDGDQTIRLKESTLKATLKHGSISLEPDTKVRLVGFLKSPTHLQVEDNTDVEIRKEVVILPPKEVYAIEDEQQLRGMVGQKVSVEGKILGFKTSLSKSTLYLLLNDTKPEFAFSIRSGFANSDELNQEYLESLVGKTVKVTGAVGVDNRGDRLNIYFKYKSHLEVSEE